MKEPSAERAEPASGSKCRSHTCMRVDRLEGMNAYEHPRVYARVVKDIIEKRSWCEVSDLLRKQIVTVCVICKSMQQIRVRKYDTFCKLIRVKRSELLVQL